MTNGLNNVLQNLDTVTDKMEASAKAAMETVTDALENWAKTEHTYTDRTSNLTNSIRGFVGEAMQQGVLTGYLTAGMEYGVFLELARSGKWAFLWPVIEKHQADILQLLSSGMADALGGGSLSGNVAGNANVQADYEAWKAARKESPSS